MLTTFAAVVRTVRRLVLLADYWLVRLQWIALVMRRERLERKLEEVNAEEDFYQEWMEELRSKQNNAVRVAAEPRTLDGLVGGKDRT